MALTYRSTGTGGANSNANPCAIAVDKPAGLTAGDLMLALVRIVPASNPYSVTPPAGWTVVSANDTGGGASNAWLFYKVATAGDAAATTFTFTGQSPSPQGANAFIHAYSGAFDTTDPISTVGAWYYNSGPYTVNINIPSITTTADDATVLLIASAQDTYGGIMHFAVPSGYTERYDGGDAPGDFCNGLAEAVIATSGTATGVQAYPTNYSNYSIRLTGIAVAINPGAPVPPTGTPTGVWASYDGTDITVTWTKPADADGAKVYRGTAPDPTDLVATLGDVQTWDDPLVPTEGTTYYYRVKATKTGSADSAYSANASVTLPIQMVTNTRGAWLFDRNRTTIALLPDFYALVTRQKFGSHSEWSGKFPPDAYNALSAAYFCQVADEDELYLVEKVTRHDSPTESYVEASGRSATAMLHQRTFLGTLRWASATHGAIVQSIINDFDASGTYEQVPVYRFLNVENNDHLYTLTPSEGFAYPAYRYEGIAWWYEPTHNATDVFRLYNATTGQHFYTTSTSERDTAIGDGWTYEGIAFPASTAGTPVYRLVRGDWHFYTMSTTERDTAISAGWTDEGIGFYIADLVETRADREIPGLVWGTGETLGTALTNYQVGYGNCGDAVIDLLAAGNLGIKAHLSGTDVIIDVFAPSTEDEVLYGDAYGNAAGSTLTRDVAAYANYAVVIGEGNVRSDVDLRDASGMTQTDAVRVERREIYVDGSSLDPTGYTTEEYQTALAAYGRQKLMDAPLVEYADADIESALSIGQMVWYDNGDWSALLMCSELETSREGGTVSYRITVGEPPLTLRQSVRRLV